MSRLRTKLEQILEEIEALLVRFVHLLVKLEQILVRFVHLLVNSNGTQDFELFTHEIVANTQTENHVAGLHRAHEALMI
ncbi:hypothetical protein SC499_23710 [Peribacillus simplex]|uniref:hypothetical protein n=1 Tax=Peribacillus simplex TaxID=1478 RepID=UPI00298E6D66|nr:hypothetical protein [Peribacillus simplex]MDW7617601.1 hypothetical protein [Peribacillus simplex]